MRAPCRFRSEDDAAFREAGRYLAAFHEGEMSIEIEHQLSESASASFDPGVLEFLAEKIRCHTARQPAC
jgi:hypothetical protein